MSSRGANDDCCLSTTRFVGMVAPLAEHVVEASVAPAATKSFCSSSRWLLSICILK